MKGIDVDLKTGGVLNLALGAGFTGVHKDVKIHQDVVLIHILFCIYISVQYHLKGQKSLMNQ